VEEGSEPVEGIVARLFGSERQAAPDVPDPVNEARVHTVSLEEIFDAALDGKAHAGLLMTAPAWA
jgi:hypothetical protein